MINVPPIALSGKNAASYVWNSYEGNFIAKMAKSAYAFFMGTKVCLSEARKYIASDATKNTYARSILERSVTLIDANSKNLLQTTARAVRTSSLRDNPNVSASTTPNPSTAPVQSMQPPVQSMQPPVQSMQPPMQSMQPPVQSMQPPMQSMQPPVQSMQPPMQSMQPPMQSMQPPMQSMQPPMQSMQPPVQSMQPPVQSMQPPMQSMQPPVQSMQPPMQSMQPPMQSMQPPMQSMQPPMQSMQPPMQSMQPPMQSMQPPVQSMQPPMQSMQPPVQSMQPPVQQSLVAATNDEPTSAEFIAPGAAPEIFNAFGAVHSFFMILPMDGSMSARFALLRNNVKDFTQEINLGRMTKKDGLNSLLKLIDDHVNFLPITSDVQERILNFIKEMLKGEKNNTQDASEIIERYRFSIQQAAAQLLNYLSTEWKLDEVGKDYILQILEDVFTMLEPANRNAPDLEQRITEKAVQFVNFLPMENRLEVFQFLPVNVQRGIIRPMFEKDRVIFLRNCTGERQREILQCHSEDVRDRIMAKIENSSST